MRVPRYTLGTNREIGAANRRSIKFYIDMGLNYVEFSCRDTPLEVAVSRILLLLGRILLLTVKIGKCACHAIPRLPIEK